ncbi:hypothetical protein [Halorarius litoreus]|uniref:hypothetical protein n=1 Tax=Halorarius litoreus TaxID=2962676 RepID=UPI0020CEF5F7|nr:hypothetical protein [Halorarius litoreus]
MPRYLLDCTACSFTATVDGDLEAVMARVDEHTAVVEAPADSHFVEFEVVEW